MAKAFHAFHHGGRGPRPFYRIRIFRTRVASDAMDFLGDRYWTVPLMDAKRGGVLAFISVD